MFTGLVEEVGECLWLRSTTRAIQLTLVSKKIFKRVHTGDSIAVNGCCLTVSSHRNDQLVFDVLQETLDRTNIGGLRQGAQVNLERALAADARLGGHFVQGHIDCTAKILAIGERDRDLKFEFELPAEFARYVAWKGSIAINGISLTVAELSENSFAVWVIPHTRKETNLGSLAAGDTVNLEFDLIAKYTERILAAREITAFPPRAR